MQWAKKGPSRERVTGRWQWSRTEEQRESYHTVLTSLAARRADHDPDPDGMVERVEWGMMKLRMFEASCFTVCVHASIDNTEKYVFESASSTHDGRAAPLI